MALAKASKLRIADREWDAMALEAGRANATLDFVPNVGSNLEAPFTRAKGRLWGEAEYYP